MSTENQIEQEVQQEEVVQEQQVDPIVEQAKAMGWRPKEDFEGDDKEFIDAKEFVSRKPLFDQLKQQSKQLKNVTKTLEQLKSHYTKMREIEFNRALAELKAARKQSVSDSDGDRFEALDDQIKEVEKQAAIVRAEAEAPKQTHDPEEFVRWTTKNSWYQKDEAMTAFADRVGLKYKAEVDAGELTPLQVLEKVEQNVRAEFPHKFRNANKDAAPNVGEARNGTTRSSDNVQMTSEEKKIMDSFLRMKNPDGSPFMTKEQYLKDFKAMKGL